MTCFSPMRGFRNRAYDPEKKCYGITFNATKALNPDAPIIMPCGYCIGCKVAKSNDWGIRASHEASLYEFEGNGSAFLTLTFDDEHLPADNSVRKRTIVAFIKRLRKLLPKGVRIRFIDCGEYGERKGRAHYHAIVFNWRFPDRKWSDQSNGFALYESELLNQAWPYGRARLGDVTFATGKYVASYTMKKVRGSRNNPKPYIRPHSVTGELHEVEREFALMSRGNKDGGGIGHDWFMKFKSDVYPCGFVVINGRRMRLPQFYVDKLSPAEQEVIKRQRKAYAKGNPQDQTPDRLRTREECLRRKLSEKERWMF